MHNIDFKNSSKSLLLLIVFFFASCEKNPDGLLLLNFEDRVPEIIRSSPSGENQHYASGDQIFVTFNREMNRASAENSFILTGSHPSNGIFRWIGNSLYYDTEKPLFPGGTFTLSVSGGAESAEGIKMEKEYIVPFVSGESSIYPEITASIPAHGDLNVTPSLSVQIQFSKPMDPDSVENAFSMSPSVHGTMRWNSTYTTFTFDPDMNFNNAVMYSITISSEAKDADGISLHKSVRLTFQTGDDFLCPAVSQVYEKGVSDPLTDMKNDVSKDSAFEIHFSETMDYSSAASCFKLKNKLSGNYESGLISWNNNFQILEFTPDRPLSPESEYEISVSSCAKDIAGLSLQNDFRLTFQTGNSVFSQNSEYLKIPEIHLILPQSQESPSFSLTDPLVLLPHSSGDQELLIVFSHSIKPSSIPENIFLSRKIDRSPAGSQAYFTSVIPGTLKGYPANTVFLQITGLSEGDEYALEFNGGRNGLLSTENFTETSTWMKESLTAYFKVQ